MATAPLPAPPADGRPAGATWVAATGAFLLLAAATLFVAVRWEQLPEEAKVALVGALTGAFLAGGRALRRSLPATGDVLFHLGALLVPIDVAALGLRLDLDWRPLLVIEGLVGVGVLGVLAAVAGSVVLRTAAASAAVVLAAGFAAVSPVPAPLVLAAAAAGAHLLGRRRPAVAWAGVAGLAPVLGAVAVAVLRRVDGAGLLLDRLGRGGSELLEELGLAGRLPSLAAVVSGAVAAAVLGREAARTRDLALVALAGACLLTGAATTWVNASPSGDAWFLAGAGLFLVLQVAAMLCQRDPFWRRPARAVALPAEIVAAVVAAPVAGVLLLMAPFVEEGVDLFGDSPAWQPEPAAAVAWAILAAGWLLAAWRRQPPQRSPLAAVRAAAADDRTVLFLATAVGAGAVVGSASILVIGGSLVALAAGLAASRGTVATLLAATAASAAPLLVGGAQPLAALPVGLAGATVLCLTARAWRAAAGGWVAAELAAGGGILAFASCAIAGDEIGLGLAMALSVASGWALGLLVERACPLAAHGARATMLVGVAGALAGGGTGLGAVAAVAALAAALFVIDAVRHDEPLIGLGASVAAPIAAAAAGVEAGLDLAAAGVALCASAVVHVGLSVPVPARWRLPLVAAAATSVVAGCSLAAGDGARFAEALVLAGGLTVAAGLVLRSGALAHGGGALAAAGFALHLVLDGVTDLEPFVAPVALQLLVAGWQLRRASTAAAGGGRTSSWVAYGPAIGLLGGAGLVERISGAPAWHGLVSGAVGVAAVAAGGWRRLAGPLFLGTALVVAVTMLESLTVLAGVPTWAWLAVGGAVLLGTGVVLERSAASPIEAGRRLVDVVEERFS